MSEKAELYQKCYDVKRQEGFNPEQASKTCSKVVRDVYGRTDARIGNKFEVTTTDSKAGLIIVISFLLLLFLGIWGYITIF